MKKVLFLLLAFFCSLFPLFTQEAERLFNRRVVWEATDHTSGYSVEIDRLTDGTYHSYLREYTTDVYLPVSLPAGDFRFRVIPHDILDRPYEGSASQWRAFQVIPVFRPENVGSEIQVIGANEEEIQIRNDERKTRRGDARRFHTLGVSVGTSFVDPLVIASAHGTFSPLRNLFIEAGCDFGFISVYDDAESYYSIFPFVNLGFFLPFRTRGGFFVGAGAGYMTDRYTFAEGEDSVSIFGFNFTAGFNLWDRLNISYTLSSDFGSVNHKLKAGYTYRFR